ncbi:MAG: hypothetical protein ABIO70_08630 [Pseudomonadota bacterium]
MPSGKDPRSGQAREYPKPEARRTRKPEPKVKREIQRVDRERGVSAELAAQLQAQWGNQAVAQLVDGPEASQIAGTTAETSGAEREEEDLLDRAEAEEPEKRAGPRDRGSGRAVAAVRGLPQARSGGGAAPQADLQFGGDDDDDDEGLPIPADGGTVLRFHRPYRSNQARMRALRARLGQVHDELDHLEAALTDVARAHSTGRGAAAWRAGTASGDAALRAPLEAWDDPALLTGRGCGPEDLEDLAGPFDGLGRPIAAARFTARLGARPVSRSIARLVGSAPGTLLPEAGGYDGAAARLGALATLALAAEGPYGTMLRDRAVRTALSEAAVEATLEVAGDIAEQVPPAHILYRRVAGRPAGGTPPEQGPSPLARHWVGAALREAGQVMPLPEVPPWLPPPEEPAVDPLDPASLVDAALERTAPQAERTPWGRVDVRPQRAAIQRLLAAGGRVQVELCAAALACRRANFDGAIAATLRETYKAFRAEAVELLRLDEELAPLQGRPAAEAGVRASKADFDIVASRTRMDAAREACIERLAAITELG